MREKMQKGKIIRCKAPLRISFAGGGTDVSPYCDERGGAVLNSTIDQFAYCTISPRSDEQVTIRSLDYETIQKWKTGNTLTYDGNLDLIKAVVNHFNVKQGFDMFLHCGAPPGSCLGSSSAVIVSIIGAMADWLNVSLSQYEIAELAYILEREELKLPGGKQDQYAAVFGGFNFMEFDRDRTLVTPLRIKSDILNELNYVMLLANTGKTRDSGNIIKAQTQGYVEGNSKTSEALDNAKRLAEEMKNALLKGEIRYMGELLNEAWTYKKNYTNNISNDYLDKIYNTAMSTGAVGGKISGAGGGGFMFFICEYDKKRDVARELTSLGANIVGYNFEKNGFQTWGFSE